MYGMAGLNTADMGTRMRKEIEGHRAYEGESLDSILTRIFKDDPDMTDEAVLDIEKSLADIEAGRLTSHEDVMKQVGIG